MPGRVSTRRGRRQQTRCQPTSGSSAADFLARGQPARAEVPGAAQDARGQVETALARGVGGLGVVEQRRRLGVDLDARRIAGAAVDLRGQAVVAVARVLLLEPRDLRSDRREHALRGVARGGVEVQRARASHRVEREAEVLH